MHSLYRKTEKAVIVVLSSEIYLEVSLFLSLSLKNVADMMLQQNKWCIFSLTMALYYWTPTMFGVGVEVFLLTKHATVPVSYRFQSHLRFIHARDGYL